MAVAHTHCGWRAGGATDRRRSTTPCLGPPRALSCLASRQAAAAAAAAADPADAARRVEAVALLRTLARQRLRVARQCARPSARATGKGQEHRLRTATSGSPVGPRFALGCTNPSFVYLRMHTCVPTYVTERTFEGTCATGTARVVRRGRRGVDRRRGGRDARGGRCAGPWARAAARGTGRRGWPSRGRGPARGARRRPRRRATRWR